MEGNEANRGFGSNSGIEPIGVSTFPNIVKQRRFGAGGHGQGRQFFKSKSMQRAFITSKRQSFVLKLSKIIVILANSVIF